MKTITTETRDRRRMTVETDDYTIVFVEVLQSWHRDARKKARVYVFGEVEVDFAEAYEMQKANDYAPRGTNPVEDKLFNKLNRQVIANKREVLEAAMEAVYELGEVLVDAKFNFSRTAGCSCPCSPGFIVDRVIRDTESGLTISDIFITRK